jgi:hypothetical protein
MFFGVPWAAVNTLTFIVMAYVFVLVTTIVAYAIAS